MLKGLDNRLNADVLYALRAMGHGDTLVICDTNFPADSIARQTTIGNPLTPGEPHPEIPARRGRGWCCRIRAGSVAVP